MKDKLIAVLLFLTLTFGLIAFVMGVVTLFADMRETASVAPTAETEEILRDFWVAEMENDDYCSCGLRKEVDDATD